MKTGQHYALEVVGGCCMLHISPLRLAAELSTFKSFKPSNNTHVFDLTATIQETVGIRQE